MERVIIVGGGVAGLSAGIFLAKAGIDSVIFEKMGTAGGNLTAWQREGFTVDNCIHWLTGTREGTALYRMWEELGALGATQEIHRPPALYRSEGEGETHISFLRSGDTTRRDMLELSPGDRVPIERFFSAVEESAEGILSGKLFRRPAALLRLGTLGRESLAAFAGRFRHPLLAAAMTDYIGGDFSAAGLALTYANFITDNADIPVGGSRAMARAVEEKYLRMGGEIRTESAVAEILIRDGNAVGVRTKEGEIFLAPAVIAACDPAVTFGGLCDLPVPKRLLRHYRHREAFPVFSAYHAAFRVKHEELPFSGTVAFPVQPFLSDGVQHSRLTVRAFDHEPQFSPEGEQILQCMLFLHESSCREWIALRRTDRTRYRRKKEVLAEALATRIAARYPVLAERISLLDSWTPASYHRLLGGFYGSFMAFAITGRALPLPAPTHTAANGLFLATQWLSPPGGLPNAAAAGKRAAEDCGAFLRGERRLYSLLKKTNIYKKSKR